MTGTGQEGQECCWLCGRPLGRRIEWHHPVPKSRGGRAVVPLHPVCHRAIHAHFTNAELAALPPEAVNLGRKEGLARFLDWIAGKPPDFHVPTYKAGGRNRRR